VAEYFLSCARYIERNPLVAGLVEEPWQCRWSSCPAYAAGVADPRLCYNVWYRGLADDAALRQQRWREFLLGDDPHERVVRQGGWTIGDDGYRRRMQQAGARPGRRRGRPLKPPAGEEGYFPEFYAETKDR
jgi:putative transposase